MRRVTRKWLWCSLLLLAAVGCGGPNGMYNVVDGDPQYPLPPSYECQRAVDLGFKD